MFKLLKDLKLFVTLGGTVLAFPIFAQPSSPSPSQTSSATCLGNPAAQLGVIYLHDADDEEPSPQERSHRELLQRLSQALDFRLSIPRGNRTCPPPLKKARCWKYLNSEMVKESNLLIQEQSESCLKKQKQRTLLGFGNGGELVSRIFQSCLEPHQKFISVEASYESFESESPTLQECGSITFVLGNYSPENLKRFQATKTRLISKGGRVHHEIFEGNYVFPFLLIMKLFKENTQLAK